MDTKSVIVLLDSLPPGLKANISAVLGMSLGKYRPELVGSVTQTADGRELPGITTIPLPILSATEAILNDIFMKDNGLDLLVAFGSAALTTKNYDEYREALGALRVEQQGIRGLLLCGQKKVVNKMVGHLPLLR